MRLGLLGPAEDERQLLSRAVELLARDGNMERVVYLGIDDALDLAIRELAAQMVGGRPEQAELYQRAVDRCLHASPEEIDRYIEQERACQTLRVFETLPGEVSRTIEILNGRVAVMIYDKAQLDEEDIVAASLLVFGKSEEPVIKRVGSRWFLSPGTFKHAGMMLLEDDESAISLTLCDSEFRVLEEQRLSIASPAQLRVQGGEP